jgi:hypothetical protein
MYLKVRTCRGPNHLGTPGLHAPFSQQNLTRPGRGRNPHHSAQVIRSSNIVHNESKAQRRDIGSLHVRISLKLTSSILREELCGKFLRETFRGGEVTILARFIFL